MKYLFLIIAFIFSVNTYAQRSYIEQVQKTVSLFVKAMEDSDIKTLSNLASSRLTYGHSGGKIESKEQFLQTFKSGATDFVKINITGRLLT